VKKIIAEGNDVAVFFELEAKAPVAATTLVAEWHQIRNGKGARKSQGPTANSSTSQASSRVHG
jgi:hypothetical protein